MNKRILGWNFVFQYGWVITNIFNSIILLPLYLKNIDVNTLGIWLATGNILAWMTLVDPGIGEVLQQRIAELRGKKQQLEIGKMVGSGFMASGIILLLSVIVGIVFYFLLEVIIDKDVSQYPNLPMALILSIIATGMSLVSFSMSGINQGLLNAANVAISSLTANFLFLFVNLYFLHLGYGVMSIAIANLCRAVYINIFNISTMLNVLKREKLKIIFHLRHFSIFIRIFSFTSLSKIISGLSNSIDMIILARFIPPAMITVFEINKRPVKITQSLIGRHSVALMPLVSHAKGTGDKSSIIKLINRQFRYYSYAAIFTSILFCITSFNLITAWTGKGQYAGDTIMYLLVANFFFGLIGYFMSNIGYALGDIKMNSLINIVRGLLIGLFMFIVAGSYGIAGTLIVSLSVIIITDFFYFTYRLYKIGYLEKSLITINLRIWAIIIPLAAIGGGVFKYLSEQLLPANLYLSKVLVTASIFTIFFLLLMLFADRELRNSIRSHSLFFSPFKKVSAGSLN